MKNADHASASSPEVSRPARWSCVVIVRVPSAYGCGQRSGCLPARPHWLATEPAVPSPAAGDGAHQRGLPPSDVLAHLAAGTAGDTGHAVPAGAVARTDRQVLVQLADERVPVRRDEHDDAAATHGPVARRRLDVARRRGVAEVAHGRGAGHSFMVASGTSRRISRTV